jgi:transcriptional regulator with XRE-family HTH domain
VPGPEDVGISAHGLRRVPGLRREEVAMLAGISSDYYLRLEQGRDRNPSVRVLEALAGGRRARARTPRAPAAGRTTRGWRGPSA